VVGGTVAVSTLYRGTSSSMEQKLRTPVWFQFTAVAAAANDVLLRKAATL